MIEQERLEEIKEMNGHPVESDNFMIPTRDFDWLIQQAELAETLNGAVDELRHDEEILSKKYKNLYWESKRLEERVEHWKKCTENEQKIAGKLQNKVEKLEKENVGGKNFENRRVNQVNNLIERNQRYKQVLEFYANPENHDREVDYSTDSGLKKSDVDIDRGFKARQVLKGSDPND